MKKDAALNAPVCAKLSEENEPLQAIKAEKSTIQYGAFVKQLTIKHAFIIVKTHCKN